MSGQRFPVNAKDIFEGRSLAPGEGLIWRGGPAGRAVARDIFHLRGMTLYFLGLFVVDGLQAWHKHLAPAKAVHDSVPLLVIAMGVLGLFTTLSWLTSRSTRYTITDRRVILTYGIAMSATLSIPFGQIAGVSVAVRPDHTADLALRLKAGNHMPIVKLWPLARPWHVAHPEPTLRGVPRGAVVGALLTRALQAAERNRQDTRAISTEMPVTPMPELMTA